MSELSKTHIYEEVADLSYFGQLLSDLKVGTTTTEYFMIRLFKKAFKRSHIRVLLQKHNFNEII